MENVSKFQKQVQWFEFYRYGAMANMLIFISCLGAVASMLSIKAHFDMGMYIAAVVSMANLVALIAQVKAEYCLKIFYGALAVNVSIMLATLFM
ncbi:MAG TPA: hypothetical protein PKN22_06435 [Taishania sp.]|nr:hypothetical protein [Taishania sp.]HNS42379.1 hypothetical protein [Taishania sp.]